jgi:small GTP-binding protein
MIAHSLKNQSSTMCAAMKVILVGETGAGKTCLSCCRVNGCFDARTMATVMTSCATIEESLASGDKVSLTVWDTAGQEKFRAITVPYYRNADVAFVCYDVTENQEATGRAVARWAAAVRERGGAACKLVLVGTKTDLLDDSALTTALDFGESVARDAGMTMFNATSARTGQGVCELFSATAAMYRSPVQPDSARVDVEPQAKKKTGCC